MYGRRLRFVHLYPEQMNLYGDRGNMIALVMRARWRGLAVEVKELSPGSPDRIGGADCIFIGGGQEKEQRIVARDLQSRKAELIFCAEKGVPILAIDSGFQMLGESYCVAGEAEQEGIGLLAMRTEAGARRMTGNIVVESLLGGRRRLAVGFENHAAMTFLGGAVKPFGRVIKGFGNNGRDKTEGALYNNVIGTYLHGPLLPKNPWLADYLLQKALEARGDLGRLPALNDRLETRAQRAILHRMGVRC